MKKSIGGAIRGILVAATLTAVVQEMRKPNEERAWNGTVWGFIPYDFRVPTLQRLKEAYRNPDDPAVLTPRPLGLGWAINLPSLLAAARQVAEEIRESCGCC